MEAVMVEEARPKVSPRRKTAALESGAHLNHQMASPTTKQTTLTSTLVDQALDDTATGIVLGKLIRSVSKASRKAISGEPGAPTPYSPSSARRVVRTILHSHGS